MNGKIFKLMILATLLISSLGLSTTSVEAAAGTRGEITGKTVAGGLLSLLIWPGIGQAMNDAPGKKVGAHAIVGLLPPFRFWSGYDALYNRQGGYWEGKI